MLLNFTVENWMSYRDEASLSMVASLERQHASTLAKIPGYRSKKALPVAAVYGGNASGKTGLFRAISALKHMVIGDVGVDDVLPVIPFMLERGSSLKPTVLDVTFLAGKTVYRYVLEVTQDKVSYESLEHVLEKGSVDIFEREKIADDGYEYVFNEDFFGSLEFVGFVGKSTRSNQTFLGNAVAQNVLRLKEAYDWFADTLQLVGVESHAWTFANAAGTREGFFEYASGALSRLDTGICGLSGERVDLDALPKSAKIRKRVAQLKENELMTLVAEKAAGDYGFEMITVHVEDDQPVVERMRTLHKGLDGEVRSFGLGMESSGTQRLMGLLPMLFDLQDSDGSVGSKVYVVDELDRCLHTMLTARLVEDFLKTCDPSTRKQLLFTTHDLLLMDQSLMRRDEMYIAQRDANGRSELLSLAEFEGIRYDKDLVRSYLDGRFGGIPMLREEVSRG